jgi:hypothetical protein
VGKKSTRNLSATRNSSKCDSVRCRNYGDGHRGWSISPCIPVRCNLLQFLEHGRNSTLHMTEGFTSSPHPQTVFKTVMLSFAPAVEFLGFHHDSRLSEDLAGLRRFPSPDYYWSHSSYTRPSVARWPGNSLSRSNALLMRQNAIYSSFWHVARQPRRRNVSRQDIPSCRRSWQFYITDFVLSQV